MITTAMAMTAINGFFFALALALANKVEICFRNTNATMARATMTIGKSTILILG